MAQLKAYIRSSNGTVEDLLKCLVYRCERLCVCNMVKLGFYTKASFHRSVCHCWIYTTAYMHYLKPVYTWMDYLWVLCVCVCSISLWHDHAYLHIYSTHIPWKPVILNTSRLGDNIPVTCSKFNSRMWFVQHTFTVVKCVMIQDLNTMPSNIYICWH